MKASEVANNSPSPDTCEEGYVLLPSAILFGREDSTTDDNLSSSEDEKILGPTRLNSSLLDDTCGSMCTEPSQPFTSRSCLHKMDKNASVLKRKLKFEPAPQEARPVPPKKQSDPQLAPLKVLQAPQKAEPGLGEAFKESVATEDVGYPPPSEPPNKHSLLSSLCLGLPSEEPDSTKDQGIELGTQLPIIKKLQTLKTLVSIVFNYRSCVSLVFRTI